jgi:hypothetical protein
MSLEAMRRKRRRKTLCIAVASVLGFAAHNLWWAHTYVAVDTTANTVLPPLPNWIPEAALLTKQSNAVTRNNTGTTPSHVACDNYRGVLHIAMGDKGGAAGTVFFQFVLGQLIYAERNQLIPWIHFNNVSHVIYDPLVHGQQSSGVTLTGLVGKTATTITRPGGHWRDVYPGPLDNASVTEQTLLFPGTGVWNHYFKPVSDFVPGDRSCQNKLYVTLDLKMITPGIHAFAPWAPSCWRYTYLHDYITQPHLSLGVWLEPQRVIGNHALVKYVKFQPYLVQAAERANPSCSWDNPCLGLHIRHSDKAAGRRRIETNEFLPFAQAFVHSGGKQIYLATDSRVVIQEIEESWPPSVKHILRTMGTDIVRSTNDTAVFDVASHHRTNQEALIEILALSQCQFMVHGLSAMSESSIWINLGLNNRSINLEDPDHLDASGFGTLVQMVLRGEPEARWPRPSIPTDEWWKPDMNSQRLSPTGQACMGYDGVLHISTVGATSSAGAAFFTDVVNQLIYAETYNLIPWVYLSNGSELIRDTDSHKLEVVGPIEMLGNMVVSAVQDEQYPAMYYPGRPAQEASVRSKRKFVFEANGIWESYFQPVSDFVPGDESCNNLPLITMDERLISPGLSPYCPWAVRAWQYDHVPDHLWNSENVALDVRNKKMRRKGSDIVKKYFRFQPHITSRANTINPTEAGNPCLALHIRVGDKAGKNREKVKPEAYLPYMEAFNQAGGKIVYIASDSHKALNFIRKSFPEKLTTMIRTQGQWVVRTLKDYPTHFIGEHHRVNSETLVDIVAMSKCSLLVHTFSTVAEAAIYLNPGLVDHSVNLEEPGHLSAKDFELMAKGIVARYALPDVWITPPSSTGREVQSTTMQNATIVRRVVGRECRTNAIVYLAQKKHSTYGRDSYSILLRSLGYLHDNYLSNPSHMNNTDVFVFHTNEFEEPDLDVIQDKLGPNSRGAVHLINLAGSPYWARPTHHRNDDPKSWYAFNLFGEGYRRMMHWYAIDIWNFFADWNELSGCNYKFIFRLDEDSFILSPIQYDIFNFFESNQYVYGYRMCAYEMQVIQRMWKMWKKRSPTFVPQRDIDLKMCGFYNNMFVADLRFFRSNQVQPFLRFIDKQGQIYRRRLGDLMIHTMAVLAFAPAERIHRFLDFTYEHGTLNETNGCLIWGGIQAGYADPNASATMLDFYRTTMLDRGCSGNATFLTYPDLSPTYSHLTSELKRKISLQTIVAGRVELPAGKNILSG